MACMSRYLENKILDHIFNGITYNAQPINLYLALFTTAPSDDTGSGAVEVVTSGGTAYARKSTAAADWADSPSTGLITNANSISMVQAGNTWGTVVAIGLYDSAIGGSNNLLFWGNISPTKQIGIGDIATFPVAGITIDID